MSTPMRQGLSMIQKTLLAFDSNNSCLLVHFYREGLLAQHCIPNGQKSQLTAKPSCIPCAPILQ